MSLYYFWAHRSSGERYAIRMNDGRLSGVAGPLPQSEVRTDRLPDFAYEDAPEDAAWAREHGSDFGLYEPLED